MASCLTCEAEMGVADAEISETLICEDCGAEHEVLSVKPLELALVDDDEEEEAAEEEDDDEEEDEDDEEVSSASVAGPARRGLSRAGG